MRYHVLKWAMIFMVIAIAGLGFRAMAQEKSLNELAKQDPCSSSDTPCELDQLKINAVALQIENDQLKAQKAQLELQLANISVMADSNAANETVDKLYKRYGFTRETHDFKKVENLWRFIKR